MKDSVACIYEDSTQLLEALKDRTGTDGLCVRAKEKKPPVQVRPTLYQYPIVRHGDLLSEVGLKFPWSRPLEIYVAGVKLERNGCVYRATSDVKLLTIWDPVYIQFELETSDVAKFNQLITSDGYKLTYIYLPYNERLALVNALPNGLTL